MTRYVSRDSGEKIEAGQIPVGKYQRFQTIDGHWDRADEGDYLITDPYMERVDQESFEREYEEVS